MPEHRNFIHGGSYYAPRRGTVRPTAVTRVAISLPAQIGTDYTAVAVNIIIYTPFFLYFIRHNSVTVFLCNYTKYYLSLDYFSPIFLSVAFILPTTSYIYIYIWIIYA